jgi:YgiT-type zinc finger domain-containing protein
MTSVMKEPCGECNGRLQRKEIVQDFERGGVKVHLAGVKAWVCESCGEVYFEPGGAQKVAQAVNSLFALVFTEEQHKGDITAQLS